ncbi:DNA/RNA nuclease SfsA [Streptomyces sp. NPDC021225]|uniref:DNA/RNA nuclease SfsA n=1 Tax=Streptomyces sp. NPDC021225 TaxID=3365121 RepID=UPI0037A85026
MPAEDIHVTDGMIHFAAPLQPATIIRRPNRFIIEADITGTSVACHCPTTGRIGNFVLDGLPCLLSRSDNPARKTTHTVEAISLDPPDAPEPTWIGINQNAANRSIETALRHNLLTDMITARTVLCEQALGHSRLDFLVNDDTYIEVKTPLQHVQAPLGRHIRTRRQAPFDSTDRMIRHIGELGDSLGGHQRAILIVCFLYDNPGFQVGPNPSTRQAAVRTKVAAAVDQGVEIWQVNFLLDANGVRVGRQTELTAQFTQRPARPADRH